MFEVGDKIFYPIHGAGVILGVEEKEFLGEKREYYVLEMLLEGLQIMVPRGQMASLGIRQVVDPVILDNVLETFHDEEPDLSINPAQRQRSHLNKMKSGDIYEAAEVIRELVSIGRRRTLGTGDRMMLDQARQVFMSEVMLVKGVTTEQASQILQQAIDGAERGVESSTR